MGHKGKRKKKDFFSTLSLDQYTRVTPPCPHALECGGCQFQEISYEDQLRIKGEFLSSLFSQPVTVMPSPCPLGYRTRMDFTYKNAKLGLRKPGDFSSIISLSTCLLIPVSFQPLFDYVSSQLAKEQFSSYDVVAKEGFMRYVSFRFAPFTNQAAIIISTTTPSAELRERFEAFLSRLAPRASSVCWQINDTLTDTSLLAKPFENVLGSPTLTHRIGKFEIEMSPFSFFQNNLEVVTQIFDDIAQHVYGEVVDLCCGVGVISLWVAQFAKNVTGIEVVQQAIALAKRNAKRNGVDNVYFFCDDMKHLQRHTPLHVDTLIVDPPRNGLASKVIEKIKALDPQKIVYMSCNPKTQRQDMRLLSDTYDLTSLRAYDVFAQTKHVETLAVLERKPR